MSTNYQLHSASFLSQIRCLMIFVCALRFAKYSRAISARCFCAFVNPYFSKSVFSIVYKPFLLATTIITVANNLEINLTNVYNKDKTETLNQLTPSLGRNLHILLSLLQSLLQSIQGQLQMFMSITGEYHTEPSSFLSKERLSLSLIHPSPHLQDK